MSGKISSAEELSRFLYENARQNNYIINTVDKERAGLLIEGLFTNLNRYGYSSCPCRFSTGDYKKDEDIICPCVYMESDVEKYGACFCGLYVSEDVNEGKKPFVPVPESRPREKTFALLNKKSETEITGFVWKCKVCGYEHRSDAPPEKCPKCGAAKAMFEKIQS
jgi:ferredoxin-thioredoxin reductase catalytic subunit